MNSETLQQWPVLVIIEDCYVPQWGEKVLEAVRKVDEETIVAAWACHGYAAEQDGERRKN